MTRSRRCASESARRTGRSPISTTKASPRRRDWTAQITPAPLRPRRGSPGPLPGRSRRRPLTPRCDAAWLREALDDLLAAASSAVTRPSPLDAPSNGRHDVTDRRRLVRVPASSANLGPGYDVLAAALSLHLELEVSERGSFSVDTGGDRCPTIAPTCASAPSRPFIRPTPGLRDPQRDPAHPRSRLLGRGDRGRAPGGRPPVRAGARPRSDLRSRVELEGHPDNVGRGPRRGVVALPGRPSTAEPPARPGPARPSGRVSRALSRPRGEVPTDAGPRRDARGRSRRRRGGQRRRRLAARPRASSAPI